MSISTALYNYNFLWCYHTMVLDSCHGYATWTDYDQKHLWTQYKHDPSLTEKFTCSNFTLYSGASYLQVVTCFFVKSRINKLHITVYNIVLDKIWL